MSAGSMEKTDGDGPKSKVGGGHAKNESGRAPSLAKAFRLPTPVAAIDGVVVLPLSILFRLLLPPLLVSSLPKRAIGFSVPRGT